MIIVLLLQIMEGMGRLVGGSFMLGFWLGRHGGYHSFSIFCSVCVLLLIVQT